MYIVYITNFVTVTSLIEDNRRRNIFLGGSGKVMRRARADVRTYGPPGTTSDTIPRSPPSVIVPQSRRPSSSLAMGIRSTVVFCVTSFLLGGSLSRRLWPSLTVPSAGTLFTHSIADSLTLWKSPITD